LADNAGEKSGSEAMGRGQDRRVTRTRAALVEAFGHLVQHRRRGPIRVAEIVAQARVGRSTFYDHYSSAEEISLEALSRPFAILADAAAGRGDPERLTGLLAHFWENRQRAREMFASGRMREKAARLLAEMVAERLGQADFAPAIPLPLASLQLAEAALAPVLAWMRGEAPATPEALARSLCRGGAALAEALADPV
jgi:AcrR family transcriptional regulator